MPPRSAPPRVNDRPVNEAAERLRSILRHTAPPATESECSPLLDAALRHERQQGREEVKSSIRELASELVNDHRGIPYDVIASLDALAATSTEEPSDE